MFLTRITTIMYDFFEKSGMVDHMWKEKGNYLPLWNEVEIIDREEYWKI